MREFCKICEKEITNEEQYSITVIDYKGEEFSKYCCSEECCLEAKNRNAKIHKDRYDSVMHKKPYLFRKRT